MKNLDKLPKIELHVHLDGSVRIETAMEILNKDIDDVKENMIAKKKCIDLNEYLTKFEYPNRILQTKENLERVAYELAIDLKKDGVIYAEVRFAPLKHLQKSLTKEEVVESVLKGLNRVDIKTNLILCMMRDMSIDDNKEVIYLAKNYYGKGVCAVDLAGAEAIYKTENFKELFELARRLNIPYTIHAGEADGKNSIISALDFKTTRLGHGIRINEDNSLVDEIIQKKVLLEICPTSNIQTNVVDKYDDHPVKSYYDKGILVSINTDNRTVSNTTLTSEYKYLMDNLDFSLEDIIKTNKYAIEKSFLTEKEKNVLLYEYENKLENYLKNIYK